MTQRLLVASALSALVLVLPRVASAAECEATTCPTGYECVETIAPSPGLPCADGAECTPSEPVIVPQCRPLPCTSDDDCAEGMKCVTQEVTECSGGSAPCADPGIDGGAPDCPEPQPEECEARTESACLPAYALPCTQASDCGPTGFTCEPVEECSCPGSPGSGGTPMPGMDGGAAEPAPAESDPARPAADAGADPVPSECTCTPTGESFCQVTTVACTEATVASDCPAGWTCRENPEGSCWSGPEGSGCEPADPPMLCAPPYVDVVGGRGEGSDSGSGEVPAGNPDGGTPPPKSGTGGTGPLAAADDPAEPQAGGCSLRHAPSPSSGALAALVLSALGLIVARRKRA